MLTSSRLCPPMIRSGAVDFELSDCGLNQWSELHTRRVHVLGSTPHPDEAFLLQTLRHLTNDVDGLSGGNHVLICDRDRKWSPGTERALAAAGIRVIRTPFRAPTCIAYTERFVRSVKEECLHRVIPLGERHFRRTLADFVAHYHGERNHQGLGNELIERVDRQRAGPVHRRERGGGLLSYYYRVAA
jgi:putative transposase